MGFLGRGCLDKTKSLDVNQGFFFIKNLVFLYIFLIKTLYVFCYDLEMENKNKKYAFIDVQNTETTTFKVLGFEVDYYRLFEYLKQNQGCEVVYLYPGIKYGDTNRENLFIELSKLGAIYRPKYYFTYKNKLFQL